MIILKYFNSFQNFLDTVNPVKLYELRKDNKIQWNW